MVEEDYGSPPECPEFVLVLVTESDSLLLFVAHRRGFCWTICHNDKLFWFERIFDKEIQSKNCVHFTTLFPASPFL